MTNSLDDSPRSARPAAPAATGCGCGGGDRVGRAGSPSAADRGVAGTSCTCGSSLVSTGGGSSANGGCGCESSPAVSGPLADASVSRGAAADAPAIGVVQEAVWSGAFASVLDDDVLGACTAPAFAAGWRRSLADPPPRHGVLVARAGAQVVGWVAFSPSDDPDAGDATAEVDVLGVHPGARGQGHGSRLLNAAVDTAVGLGFTRLTGWVPEVPAATGPHAGGGARPDIGGLERFLAAAGPAPDGARRRRVVSPDGRTVVETRYAVSLPSGAGV